MIPKYEMFVQEHFESTMEWKKINNIAHEFYDYLKQPSIIDKINVANQPKNSSKDVQDILMSKALEIGFKDEDKTLFSNTINKLRPDFYMKVGDTGIIIEVERGKTNDNNMDFLDFWKCHICEDAHYLFLFVPLILLQNTSGKNSKRPYEKVLSHMKPFFYKENYTNVRGLVLFGY